MYREEFVPLGDFISAANLRNFEAGESGEGHEPRGTNAKMREDVQEERECLLKIQRGRGDVIAPSDDFLWSTEDEPHH